MVREKISEDQNSTLLRCEVENIWQKIREHPEIKEVGVKLISMLKAEKEGRQPESKERLEKRRKVFAAVVLASV